jgi:hypothetical protein
MARCIALTSSTHRLALTLSNRLFRTGPFSLGHRMILISQTFAFRFPSFSLKAVR